MDWTNVKDVSFTGTTNQKDRVFDITIMVTLNDEAGTQIATRPIISLDNLMSARIDIVLEAMRLGFNAIEEQLKYK